MKGIYDSGFKIGGIEGIGRMQDTVINTIFMEFGEDTPLRNFFIYTYHVM
jgi:hypothetical protein